MNWHRRDKFELGKHKDRFVIGLLILGILINLIYSGSNKAYFLTNGKELEEPGLDQFCNAFIEQIINKKLHPEMVESDIYDILVDDNYQVLKLVGSEKPLYTRVKNEKCSVIIKDKLGLRRFDIGVNKSFDYPFYYRVQLVDEPSVEG